MDLYCMDFDELGVVAKLALSAFQRHQNHHQPTNIDVFRGHVVIFAHFRSFFLVKNQFFQQFQTFSSGKNAKFKTLPRNASILAGS